MIIENKIIDTLDVSILNLQDSIFIKNCIIKTINFDLIAFKHETSIEGCIIDSFLLHACWFENGLHLINNQFNNYIDYQMGGHNLKPINLVNNIFVEFFNFFDCHFEELIKVNSNIFLKGSNLLGNKLEGFHNTFDKGIVYKNNVGKIDANNFGT